MVGLEERYQNAVIERSRDMRLDFDCYLHRELSDLAIGLYEERRWTFL